MTRSGRRRHAAPPRAPSPVPDRRFQLEKELAKNTAPRKPSIVKGKRDPEKAAEKQKKILSDKDTRDKRFSSMKSYFGPSIPGPPLHL